MLSGNWLVCWLSDNELPSGTNPSAASTDGITSRCFPYLQSLLMGECIHLYTYRSLSLSLSLSLCIYIYTHTQRHREIYIHTGIHIYIYVYIYIYLFIHLYVYLHTYHINRMPFSLSIYCLYTVYVLYEYYILYMCIYICILCIWRKAARQANLFTYIAHI